MTIVKQKCLRLFHDISNNEVAMHELVHNNEQFVEKISQAIRRECDAKNTVKMNKKWKKDYEKQGYTFMPRDNIFKDVSKTLKLLK